MIAAVINIETPTMPITALTGHVSPGLSNQIQGFLGARNLPHDPAYRRIWAITFLFKNGYRFFASSWTFATLMLSKCRCTATSVLVGRTR